MNDHETTAARPLFLGFLAKRSTVKPEWLKADVVTEICSVSDCVAPEAAPNHGSNAFGLHDARDAMLITVPPDRSDTEIFAYRAWPVEYDEAGAGRFFGSSAGVALPEPPDLSSWERIGYDVIARDDEALAFMWHSPLSCNSVAEHHATNQYCLIDDLDDAIELARSFSDPASRVEPGPYVVVEVLRDPQRPAVRTDR